MEIYVILGVLALIGYFIAPLVLKAINLGYSIIGLAFKGIGAIMAIWFLYKFGIWGLVWVAVIAWLGIFFASRYLTMKGIDFYKSRKNDGQEVYYEDDDYFYKEPVRRVEPITEEEAYYNERSNLNYDEYEVEDDEEELDEMDEIFKDFEGFAGF